MNQLVLAADYQPHSELQRTVHASGKRFIVIAAGIRGGKTVSATVEMLRRVFLDLAAGKGRKPSGIGRRRQPRLLYWVVAPTTGLNVHVHRYVTQFCPRELIERIYEDAIWLKDDVLIEFKTAERPDLLVGASVNGMLVDEACRVKAEAWRGALRGRLADTGGWAIFASSPLGGKNSWVYQEFVAKAGGDANIESIHWKTADNKYIPREEVEYARETQPAAWFKRDWEASWDSFGGSVYEEFNDDNIVSEAAFRVEYGLGSGPIPSGRLFQRVIIGVDWGITSPGAMVVIGKLGENNFVVLEESYAPGRPILGEGTTWLSEAVRLKNKWGATLFACDPARPDAIRDLATNGLPTIGAYNDIYLGIRRVAEAVHRPSTGGHAGLRIFSSCQHLISELRSYTWKTTRDGGAFTEVPAEGQSDHAADALRYGIVELRPYPRVHGSSASTQNLPSGYRRGPVG